MRAVNEMQRPAVAGLLGRPRDGGAGLRMWVQSLASRGAFMPPRLPAELVQVYIDVPEALPLHDCAGCGLSIPIQPSWSLEAEPQRVFFPRCPHCGGETGRFAYWSRQPKDGFGDEGGPEISTCPLSATQSSAQ